MRLWNCLLVLLTASCLHWHLKQAAAENDEDPQLYIVYLGENVHKTVGDTHAHHHQILGNVFERKESILECIVYHYKHGFSGFSAMLTPSQASLLSDLPEVVSVFRSGMAKLHTTRSWAYMGLNEATGVWPEAKFGDDVIIGVIDTGIWPESASFVAEAGLSPVPARWKGTCQNDTLFNSSLCNKKLIGAKFFFEGYRKAMNDTSTIHQSVRDYEGHGTHTASTAGGSRVQNVSFRGFAPGTAVGVAPSAKLAIYKVCWPGVGCSDSDIMAAYDEAIKDGVDIISASLGIAGRPFDRDSQAIASFHATKKGILVSISAGNDGLLGPGKLFACAPWQLTVGASTMDRTFKSDVVLGDGTLVEGATINSHTQFVEETRELVNASSIPAMGVDNVTASFCKPGSLDPVQAAGKVVVCEQQSEINQTIKRRQLRYAVDATVVQSNGYGVIVSDRSTNFTDNDYPFTWRYSAYGRPIPGSGVEVSQANEIKTYLSSTVSPTATIKQPRTVIKESLKPATAIFSSRGPNSISKYILKPDLTAPGVDILAAWTGFAKPGEPVYDYKFDSGTSMSCPHVSGAAALLKSIHPTWSPAAIKSAFMTTATPLETGNSLDWGAGEINITKAADPGLIYDLNVTDYMTFLCSSNLTALQYTMITGELYFRCPTPAPSPSDLNYPTITVDVDSVVTRVVTNVGEASSVYTVSVVEPPGTTVTVEPTQLAFTKVGENQKYTVTVKIVDATLQLTSDGFGSLKWTDGVRDVNSVIFINTFVYEETMKL